jgi:hypothetical protein
MCARTTFVLYAGPALHNINPTARLPCVNDRAAAASLQASLITSLIIAPIYTPSIDGERSNTEARFDFSQNALVERNRPVLPLVRSYQGLLRLPIEFVAAHGLRLRLRCFIHILSNARPATRSRLVSWTFFLPWLRLRMMGDQRSRLGYFRWAANLASWFFEP